MSKDVLLTALSTDRNGFVCGMNLIARKRGSKMIKPYCEICRSELQEYGGILLSPPHGFGHDHGDQTVSKYHVCRDCWPQLIERLKP